jgi:hypothetical protein
MILHEKVYDFLEENNIKGFPSDISYPYMGQVMNYVDLDFELNLFINNDYKLEKKMRFKVDSS